jgi:tight adherence protein C
MIPPLSPATAIAVPVLICLALAAVVAGMWEPLRRENKLRHLLADIRANHANASGPAIDRSIMPHIAAAVAAVGLLLTRSGIVSQKSLVTMRGTVNAAGLRGERALPIFIGAKVLLLLGLPLMSWIIAHYLRLSVATDRLLIPGAAVAGLLGPDFVLRVIRKRYLASVERAIPDALDLLVICAEAGLALEQGMERVAAEIQISSAPCAAELAMTRDELRILADRRLALVNLGQRTGLVSLQRLGGTLAQALRYGTPLSQALRTLAAELRTDALTRFEERAGRLPVLMTLPMILFILPCVFMVVAGPAMLNVMHWSN